MTLQLFTKDFFFDTINQARLKRYPTDYALINTATFSMMFPDLKKHITSKDDNISVYGVKIQLSIYAPQDKIYLDYKMFDIELLEARKKFQQYNF